MATYPRVFIFLASVAMAGGMSIVQAASLTPAQKAAAIQSEKLTIPTPGEFFSAINKQGKPNWPTLIRKPVIQNTTNRAQIALNLGTFIADGYIAVEAQDGQQVKNVGKDIITLAKALGVSQDIINRGNTINDFAENNDWNGLNEELEATENEVKLTMEKLKDTDLITLVTLGAWIRGVQVASGIVTKAYTPASAKLLRQPAVIQYLLVQIGKLPPKLQSSFLVAQVQETLKATEALVNTPTDTPVAEATVREINEKMNKLIDEISTHKEGAPAK
ncbi:MAG: hypothetical protein ABI615_03135 [Chthoniobacterales bacterium]